MKKEIKISENKKITLTFKKKDTYWFSFATYNYQRTDNPEITLHINLFGFDFKINLKDRRYWDSENDKFFTYEETLKEIEKENAEEIEDEQKRINKLIKKATRKPVIKLLSIAEIMRYSIKNDFDDYKNIATSQIEEAKDVKRIINDYIEISYNDIADVISQNITHDDIKTKFKEHSFLSVILRYNGKEVVKEKVFKSMIKEIEKLVKKEKSAKELFEKMKIKVGR